MPPYAGLRGRHSRPQLTLFALGHFYTAIFFVRRCFCFKGLGIGPAIPQGLPELAKDLHFSSASIRKPHTKEDSMLCHSKFPALLLISGFFISMAACARSQVEEIGPLPTTLSTEQLQSLPQLSPTVVPAPPQPRARRRLPRPVVPLTAEEISYRSAVQELGVDKHRFVHCELLNGKVRTGVITEIREDGFTLKDGIIISQWIPFSDLKAAPRPVPAVGTRIGQGFKWTGLIAGCIAAVPLVLPMYVLVAAGVIQD
jgi:hypothetical protein